jgi:hypothetical protein
MSFYKKWKKDYDAQIRALEKGKAKGFEEAQEEDLQEVDAAKAMETARVEVKEREERKALTRGAKNESDLAAPKMNVKVCFDGTFECRVYGRLRIRSLMFCNSRVPNWVGLQERDTSFPLYSLKHTKIEKFWKKGLLKQGGTGRRLGISMVRGQRSHFPFILPSYVRLLS